MALVRGAALQRPAKSSCMVVSTPAMEEEAYRLRTMALLLTAASDCSGITPDMVAEAVERSHRFRFGDIEQVIGQNCKLDLIERESTTRRNRCALFAWVWTWNPDMIPRASDLTVLSKPDCVRSRESLPEGAPVEEGVPEDEVKKKVFPLYLKDKALTCAKYGLDSEIVDPLRESFAAHIDLPKEKWFKYHPPLEVNVVKPTLVEEKVIAYNDPVVPSAYIEKPPFPVRIKVHSKASTVIRRGYIKTPTPREQIRVEPSIAIIKDLLSEEVEGHNIHLCEDATRIAKPHARDKHRPVVGKPVVSVKIGDHCYHGLCDMGASVSAMPQSLYDEIKDEIAPVEIEPIDVTIHLANRDTICPLGIVRDVEVLCGKTKYPADFLILATAQDSFCPIIFGRPFLNTINAHIDCDKQTVTVGFEGVSHEFNFSKFGRRPHEKELPSKDETIALASIAVPPTDPLEQYLLEHENDMHMDERDRIDRVVLEQYPILKNNLPLELLGDPPPPKGDPVFELKQLPDTLKYAYLDEKEIYPVIISASLSEHEEKKLY
ncbi:hypothetical protein ZWY2020_044520 [Hordeum vulgare]|nr:hypothetical protein ZWY2020_044520 [Hordeum vulgare]